MDVKENIALKLIEELKKPGRECIYDMGNRSYKNTYLKQNIWTEIEKSIGIGRSECQILWKSLRRRYKAALTKNNGKSGSERVAVKGFSRILMTEMDFFQNFCEDKDCTITNYTDSNTASFQSLFEEMASDPDVINLSNECNDWGGDSTQSTLPSSSSATQRQKEKRKRVRVDDPESEYKESLKTLNNLAEKVFEATTEKRDPFFLAMEEEFSKVPDNRKSQLKLKLMALIVEEQVQQNNVFLN